MSKMLTTRELDEMLSAFRDGREDWCDSRAKALDLIAQARALAEAAERGWEISNVVRGGKREWVVQYPDCDSGCGPRACDPLAAIESAIAATREGA